ncbi:TPA: VapE domain-containing protein [Enterobacter hormaechei subsp. hoffmannii]|uniref:VapE domain-containing protein n=1 Tax=Enterobacter TaxID=547 RepID=UPI000735BDE9|nr:VapE domain-containing protein [Enterobacter hormaechei]MDM3504669.1 replication protein [Enterobacter cloacae]HCM9114134.1 replication protein [Enterobacter hormaechei subsp. steigerwaltii]EKS6365373.1 replication protein [Enterobacter hormaechei]EKW7173461.1 replication protein [Enterobacter hormaechei]EKW7269958.1 replication protein [Enterobacter hormaechei]
MPEKKIWGATPDEWFHFDLVLGRTDQLLPVVCNPGATISPNSKLKMLGKTPSLYNRDRLATGIAQWTEHVVTEHDFARWSNEPDYGICVRTGHGWLALDCDSEDEDIQADIRKTLVQLFGELPPRRWRANSNKCLYLLAVGGDFRKRIHRLAGDMGIIELLANGQQFVACGTHSSGARIEWDGGLPDEPPAITADQLETLWQRLADQLPVSVTTEAGSTKMRDRSTFTPGATDDTAEYLDANGWTLLDGANGERYIRCPFEDGHSTGGDPTSTVYFPGGTAGFEQGHFKCLHASCAHRGDGDFLNAIGIRNDDFEDLTSTDVAEPLPLPAFERDKWGRIEATISNAAKAVVRPDFVDIDIRFDQFRDEIMFAQAGSGQWQAFTDADYARLRITMEKRGFKPVGRELIRDVVLLAADEQPFDSATTWLNGLEWDGVPRIESFYHTHFGTADTPYTRAVSMYMWTALAGRVLEPGVKADMVPILVGPQGCGKSSGVEALSPDPAFFTEISFAEKDDDLARKMRGRLVAEIGELRGLNTKELESIKAFVTRTHENWIPKYREFATQFPRRLVFVGTTNEDEFLADKTGNRRWLPVEVSKVDVKAIKTDLLLLWAESRETFKRLGGIQFRDAERLGASVHEQYTIKDAWLETVEKWLDTPDLMTNDIPRNCEFLRASDVLRDAIGLNPEKVSRREQMRISGVLQNCGYKASRETINGKQQRVFIKQ